MARTVEQQIHELVKQTSAILIALPQHPSTDAIASGLALFSVLEKMGKNVKVVSSNFALPNNHQFLPRSTEILSELTSLRKFIVSVDISKTPVSDLSYTLSEHPPKLDIFITPKSGFFEARDVTSSSGSFAFGAVIVLDAPDLQSLGPIYTNNAEFFYRTPIINIDHASSNDHFGQVNLVNVTATSTSELLFEMIQAWGPDWLDELIATHLLTGIISKTKSFKSGSVTPKSLAIASHLIASGARREEIVKHLYQQKTLTTLRLWGKTLAKLKSDTQHKLVWSVLSRSDFAEAGAQPDEIRSVVDELVVNTPEAETICVLYELPTGSIQALIVTPKWLDGAQIMHDLEPKGNANFTVCTLMLRSLVEAEDLILGRLRKAIAAHL